MFNEGCTAASIVGDEIDRHSRRILEMTGYDVFRSAGFWETWVALQLGGVQTDHKNVIDVEVNIWGMDRFAEVKFSRAFWCKFSGIRGKDWSRNVFKWTLTKRQSNVRRADALILIGVDIDDLVYFWVFPFSEIPTGGRGITITAPSSRSNHSPGRLDKWNVPPIQLLPEFARVCHNRYDAPMRRAGIRARQRAKAAIGDLI